MKLTRDQLDALWRRAQFSHGWAPIIRQTKKEQEAFDALVKKGAMEQDGLMYRVTEAGRAVVTEHQRRLR